MNWRFRVPDDEAIVFDDLTRAAELTLPGSDFGDFVVWRRDDVPAYQLAVVADDAAMQITEVVRGADLLKSTARQLLLIRALSLPVPAYYHCDLVRDEGGTRLAKRHDALSLRALREHGGTPQEVLKMCYCTLITIALTRRNRISSRRWRGGTDAFELDCDLWPRVADWLFGAVWFRRCPSSGRRACACRRKKCERTCRIPTSGHT